MLLQRALALSTLLGCAAPAPNAMPLGANIDGVVDYSFTLALVDVVKQARAWGSAQSPWDGNCSVGADGWPAQPSFGNVFITAGAAGPVLAGAYAMSFTGNASVVPANGASATNQVYDAATDSTTATLVLAPNACNCLMFGFEGASTRAGPGIKDLRILQPGYALDGNDTFSRPLLALLGRADVLRFMDWGRTNGNLIADWSARTLPSSFSYAPQGSEVPWEVIFDLANELGKDAWINVPVHATDDYVLQLATLAAARLAPGLNLYLEYSNEVWNWSFEQSHFALAAANASVYAGDPYHLNASGLIGDGNPGYWMIRWYVAKLKAFSDIFRTVFGADAVGRDKRVRPVYAWQCGGDQDSVGLPYLLQIYGEPASFFHSIACAPYMTIGDVASSPALTADEVLAGWRSYQQNISLAGAGFGRGNYVAALSAAGAYWGLAVQAYEAGPDTAQGLNAGGPLFAKGNASADPRISPIIFDYLQSWHELGAHMGPMNYFTFGAGPLDDKYGIYAVLQDMSKMDTPKLAAIDAARATPVALSPLIPAVPSVLNASFFVGHPEPATPDGFSGWPAACDYMVFSAAPQRLAVTLTVGTDDAGTQNLTVGLGGAARNVQTVFCASSGNWATYVPCNATAPFDVPAGVSVFRVTRGRQWLGEVRIAAA